MIGFYFNNEYSGDYNVYWTPKANEWFGQEDFEVIQEESSYLPGGYYLGNRAKIRTFTINCFFEEITQAQKKKILRWLSKDNAGEQVMDNRPMVVYDVRVKDKVVITEYPQNEYISGTFTITFVAYNPYGKLLSAPYGNDMEADGDSGYDTLPEDIIPSSPSLTDRTIFVYNPGEVSVPLNIQMMGYSTTGDIVFTNQLNGTICKMVDMESGMLPTGSYFDISGENMTTYIRGGAEQENGCAYHDMGYIALDPNEILANGISVNTTAGSNAITGGPGTFMDDMVGAYIYLEGTWKKIVAVADMEHATVFGNNASTSTSWTYVTTMNVIDITSDGDITFTKLDIDYTPRVR